MVIHYLIVPQRQTLQMAERQQERPAFNQGKNHIGHISDRDIKQKKAMLYDLKNKLLKYENFQGVPIEELESLCENLNTQKALLTSQQSIKFQGQPQTSNLDSHPSPSLNPSNSQQTTQSLVGRSLMEKCCQNVYIIKLKQIMIIGLVILCIIVKNNMSTNATYDMGQFSIYETKYSRSMFEKQQINAQQLQKGGFKFLSNVFGLEKKDDKIKLYLPRQLQKMKNKDKKQLSYEKCIKIYSPICIDHRLSLYGSMNLELEDWILNHINGQQKLIFQPNVDYLLSIVLSALKMKQQNLEGREINKIAIIQSNSLESVELNSIKLSLIQNECQNYVEIIKLNQGNYQQITQFSYVFTSQEFYVYNIYPFGQDALTLYPNTKFIIYMPHGMSDLLKVLLKQIDQKQVTQIELFIQDGKYYREKLLQGEEINFKRDQQKMRIVVMKFSKRNQMKLSNLKGREISNPQVKRITPKKQQGGPMLQQQSLQKQKISYSQIQHQSLPVSEKMKKNQLPNPPPLFKQKTRQIFINEHECIKQYSYDILPIMSYFDKNSYIQTVQGIKLLVSNEKSIQYKQKGAISPELIFFISQNLNSQDTVFYPHQLYQDDLILMTIAKSINSSGHFFCITPQEKNPVLMQNLRMNGYQKLVQFVSLDMQQQDKISNFYKNHSFNIFFTTLSFLNRDFKYIYEVNKQSLIIFYWQFDINYFQFIKSLAKKHKMFAILERFQKMNFGEDCINYGLLAVNDENILQMDKSWLILQT